MSLDLHALLKERLREAATLWAKDLRAHDPEHLTVEPKEGVRSAADIAWECVLTNRRLAMRIRGEEPFTLDGFPACPPEFATIPALIKALSESTDEILAAAGDDVEREVSYPGGSESVFAYAEFAGIHMMYHLGQINYIQTLYGDPAVHWRG
ncbi:DinB family protein [bacterium]|nr:MAG: DinB family protein [bacterium]